jgi:glutamate dehydrogenase/leucine dehydrogenase
LAARTFAAATRQHQVVSICWREVLQAIVLLLLLQVFNAYRVQHNNSRGPFKGGLRYHHQVDLDDVRRCELTCTVIYVTAKGNVVWQGCYHHQIGPAWTA